MILLTLGLPNVRSDDVLIIFVVYNYTFGSVKDDCNRQSLSQTTLSLHVTKAMQRKVQISREIIFNLFIKVEQYLKTADYEPNKSDFFGWTPLHAACAGFNFYIIRLLLEHGEDPASMDKRGNSAFQVMIKWNRVDQELVSDYRSTFRSMMKHAKAKHGDDIVNRVFDNQETCLHTAINKAEQAAVDSKCLLT